jgi:DNA-binding NarL/FixJ family response regulator
MENTRVVLIDDHPVVRQGLQSLLSQYPDIQVVGEAGNNPDALELIVETQPDIILLDIRLLDQNGLSVARQLQRLGRKSRVIVLTSHNDESYLLEAAQAGVYGYLLKSASAEVLADAIRAVHAGERRLSPGLLSAAMKQLVTLSQYQAKEDSGLSDQELQMLKLISNGASTREVAEGLYLSERTVKRKIQDIHIKLGATSRAQAVAEALKRGLI